MKLTGIILLAACLQVSAKGITQTVNLSANGAPFIEVIKSIERQTHFAFFYKVDWLSKAKKVTIKAVNMPLKEALDICFKNQPFTYIISGRNITIRPRDEETSIKQPPIDISGKIFDKDGNPLSGANIKIQGTQKGTFTNADGSFTLKDVDENSVLEISYVGFEPQIISVQSRRSLVINLNPKNSVLDETVVIAYGTTTKRLNTGNVSTVKAVDIAKQPVNNPLLALQGRVPGLFITQTSGLAGSGVVVRIQGQNSLSNGNGPLYIIDGVPFPVDIPVPTGTNIGPLGNSGERSIKTGLVGRGNALSMINPSDIESIEVLKDADATAIYGSRAANGAILITTKKGKGGKSRVDLKIQHGWGQVANSMDLLSTQQYIEMRKEAFANDGIAPIADPSDIAYAPDLLLWDSTRYTDWQKVLIGGTAHYTEINSSVSGGTQAIQYLISGTYHKETTVFPGSFSDERGVMHINLNNSSANQKLHFQVSANYLADNNQLPRTDLTEIALLLAPNAPELYNADGTLNWALNSTGTSTWENPMAAPMYRKYQTKTNTLVANTFLSYQILPELKVSGNLGYTTLHSKDIQTNALLAEKPENRPFIPRFSTYGNSNVSTWIFEPQVIYNKVLGRGRFDALIGSTLQKNSTEAVYIDGIGYNNDQVLESPAAAAELTSAGHNINQYKYSAIFARLNYTWQDKYILNVSGRRDGSSRFGDNSKIHNFGSVGAAWIFSEETHIKNNLQFLSFGKIKGSYGVTGSDQIGDYKYLSLYTIINPAIPYQGTTGLAPGDIPNAVLEWEETKKLNLGIELGLFNDRILLTGNYALNKCSNQLLDYNLPRITGRSSVLSNFPATVQNTNWEFSLNTTNIKNASFTWTSNFNLTIARNKLLSFPNIELSSYNNSLIVGQPINIQRAYHYLGVDGSTGLYTVADSHGDPTATPSYTSDALLLLTTFPKYYGGFQNTIRYKGFELDVLLQFVKQIAQAPIYTNSKTYLPGFFYSFDGTGNQPATIMDRWQKPGDKALVQKFTATDFSLDAAQNNVLGSDANYDDASFVRVKNVSLSWGIPASWKQKMHLQNCRFTIQGQNLFTITSYKGLDPENKSLFSLPPLRLVTVGLEVGL